MGLTSRGAFFVLLEIIFFEVFALGDVERRVFSSNFKVLFLGFQGEVRGLGRCDRGGLYADSAERPADRGGSSEVGKTAGDQGNHFFS